MHLFAWKLGIKLSNSPLVHTVQMAQDRGLSPGQINEHISVEDLEVEIEYSLGQNSDGTDEQSEENDESI